VRRRLTAAALALIAATLLFADAGHAAPDTALRAGAARVPLQLPEGAPLAGYGSVRRRLLFPDVFGRYPHAFWFRPNEGLLDPLGVRALVLYMGTMRLTWVSADLIAVDQEFRRRLEERLGANGIRPGTLIVSVSHTHSGPGAFLAPTLFALAALDRESTAVRDAILDAMVEAIRRAGAGARDARVAAATVEAPPITVSRLAGEVDREVLVLKVTASDGAPIALLWNYAIHGTMLGPSNRRLSGDVMGMVSRVLEGELGVPALYVNGAVGDVSPRLHGHGEAVNSARLLGDAVRAAWATAAPVPAIPLVVQTARVRLPSPRVSLQHCVARWLPSWARLPIGRFLPRETEVTAAALGAVAWVTMPGEPTTALGRELKAAARGRWTHAFVAGLTNDYLGYFIRPDDYARRGYVTCAAVYGPRLGPCLTATATDLLRRLKESGHATEVIDRGCDAPPDGE
jgi:hypothetical protein